MAGEPVTICDFHRLRVLDLRKGNVMRGEPRVEGKTKKEVIVLKPEVVKL